ncbi:MAG TPA: isoprenylcysteine carboxylmethyltransferase family protein [Kiritimatiellia bacterium]|nr:isoprenylcysteine carboxylmethyltransferase family protein [Kiritimatiellia bacterium]
MGQEKEPLLMRIRGVSRRGLTLVILGLIAAGWVQFDLRAFVAGGLVLLLGLAIHFYAKGCLIRKKVVTTVGPYRWVRHPFYLGNLVVDTGLCIMSGSALLFLVYFIIFLIGYTATMRDEERILTEIHGDAYREYAKRVPRLFPVRGAAPPMGEGEFSWEKIIREHELARGLRIVMYPAMFWVAFSVRSQWEAGMDTWGILSGQAGLNLVALSMLVAVYLIARTQDLVATRLERINLPLRAKLGGAARWLMIPAVVALAVAARCLPVAASKTVCWTGLALVVVGVLIRAAGEFGVKGPASSWTRFVFKPAYFGDVVAVCGLATLGGIYWLVPAIFAVLISAHAFLVAQVERGGSVRTVGGPLARVLFAVVVYAAAVTLLLGGCPGACSHCCIGG